jgi:hypothetical protein
MSTQENSVRKPLVVRPTQGRRYTVSHMALRTRGFEECGFISINAPGGFEEMMPHIVKRIAEHPLEDVAAT